MSEEPIGEYMTLVTEPTSQVVECPACHVRIGHVIRRNNERWLAVGGLLISWVPFGLCAACEETVYFGRRKPRTTESVLGGK